MKLRESSLKLLYRYQGIEHEDFEVNSGDVIRGLALVSEALLRFVIDLCQSLTFDW